MSHSRRRPVADWSMVLSAMIVAILCTVSPGRAQSERPGELKKYKVGGVYYATVLIPDGYRLSVRTPDPFLLSDLSANLRCDGFAITGAFASLETGGVEGLVVVDGRIVSEMRARKDGGFLVIDGNTVLISRVGSPPAMSRDHPISVVQSHPILMIDGFVDFGLNRQERANRVALGKLANGQLFMVMAYNTDRNGLSAVTFGRFARDVDGIMGGRVDWLMNFDGGPSAFLAASGRAVAPSPGRIVSYICAEPVT